MIFLLLIACGSFLQDRPAVEDRSALRHSLTGNFRTESPDLREMGEPFRAIKAQVRPVRFSLSPGFDVSAALWVPDEPSGVGVVVAHGHYGQGKSGAEAQEIAHRLAARGAHVLAVDTPGVEEWATPERQIHFAEGAHNRGILISRGTSALALQIDILRRGVDVLESLGARRFGATGASGGAVQAFYLGWMDDRVQTAVMASFPPMPREAAASGCACDHIPGHPGPDPHLLGQWTAPTLWMSDVQQDRPAGLSSKAEFVVEEGAHSYTLPMQRRALKWFETHLDLPRGPVVDQVPNLDLTTGSVPPDGMAIADLPAYRSLQWTPQPRVDVLARVSCQGEGPVILTLGSVDGEPLRTAGWTVCNVDVPAGESAWTEAVGMGRTFADDLAGAVAQVVREKGARAIWAHRGWGLVASAQQVPFVVHEPIEQIEDLRSTDPPWVHVPGAWEGSVRAQLSRALAKHTDAESLVDALKTVEPESKSPAY